MLKVDIGQEIYCPKEGWSGTVRSIEVDEDGEGVVAILRDHDPKATHPWICMPLDCYKQDEEGYLHS